MSESAAASATGAAAPSQRAAGAPAVEPVQANGVREQPITETATAAAAPTPPVTDAAEGAEADAELLKQQLQLIQLCFAEHEFGIVVDDEEPRRDGDFSSSSSSSRSSSSTSDGSLASSDSAGGTQNAQRHRKRCARGAPAYDPLTFVNGKVQHGVPLAVLSQDLHAYAQYLEDRIAQCVNTDVHTAFVNVSGHLVGMRDELSYMERPLTAAMKKLSDVVGQLATTSQAVKRKVEAACAAEMERAFDAVYLRSLVVYETIAYQLDDLAGLLNITVDPTTAAAAPAATGASSATPAAAAAGRISTGDKAGVAATPTAAAPPLKMVFVAPPGAGLTDTALDALEDVVLLFQELKEIQQRLGALPSRAQERAEVAAHVAAAEQSVMGVLEVVLVHTSQLAFGPPAAPESVAKTSSSASGTALPAGDASASLSSAAASAGARQLLGRVIELYAQAGEMEQFCAVFRNAVLRPPLELVVSWKAATQARQSAEGTVALLKRMKAVLQTTFLPLLPLLRERYGAALNPAATVVWPVLSETLVKKLPSLYEVGIPNHFQAKYKAAYELLAVVEGACADLEELAALRQSPDLVLWNHKWNLDVYAALRVSEVDKALQSVSSPLDRLPATTESAYHLRVFFVAQQQLLHLFSSAVFLLPCTPRFLRQTVTCCYRVLTRVQEAVGRATPNAFSTTSDDDKPASAPASEHSSTAAAAAAAAAADGAHDALLLAISDVHALRQFLTGQLLHVILGRVEAATGRSSAPAASAGTTAAAERSTAELVTDVLQFASTSVCGQFVQRARATLVHHVTDASLAPLQNLKSVRSAYSHTRKTMPSAASWYVGPALQPLQRFAEEAQRSGFAGAALQETVAEMLRAVAAHFVALARETLITAKKTEESWEKLRRRKEIGSAATPTTAEMTTGNGAEGGSGGAMSNGQRVTMETATDRDRMTIQLWMDARAMQDAVQQPPLRVPAATANEAFAPALELLRRAEWIQGADIPEPPDVDA